MSTVTLRLPAGVKQTDIAPLFDAIKQLAGRIDCFVTRSDPLTWSLIPYNTTVRRFMPRSMAQGTQETAA